jgi:hypothetical protein
MTGTPVTLSSIPKPLLTSHYHYCNFHNFLVIRAKINKQYSFVGEHVQTVRQLR